VAGLFDRREQFAMATQRLTVAAIAGDAAAVVERLWRGWQTSAAADASTVDHFCYQLRAHGTVLPVVYFCQWVDRLLMGDLVPGPGAVDGKQFQLTCLTPDLALARADQCGSQFAEQQWLAVRLREAAEGWGGLAKPLVVVVVREVLGGSTTDEEVEASLRGVPGWLSGWDRIG
jgi:hypothetical protein